MLALVPDKPRPPRLRIVRAVTVEGVDTVGLEPGEEVAALTPSFVLGPLVVGVDVAETKSKKVLDDDDLRVAP